MGRQEMAHNIEPKMDDLKRLLRRLDGLDGSKGISKTTQEVEADQRGYVGALRGAPMTDEDGLPIAPPVPEKTASYSAVYIAAAAAAAISTATVYFVMSWQAQKADQGVVPSSERAVPSKLDFRIPQPGGAGQQRQSTDTPDGLVRRAEQLLRGGDVSTARILLQRAAELGSGAAALKLGRSYDPTQAGTLRYADSQTNPALAKAWYERALALGTQEAAAYISDPGAR